MKKNLKVLFKTAHAGMFLLLFSNLMWLQLFEVGGKKFLDLEAEAFMKFEAENSVISLTGSQPMNDDAMAHARKLGSFICAIFVSQLVMLF